MEVTLDVPSDFWDVTIAAHRHFGRAISGRLCGGAGVTLHIVARGDSERAFARATSQTKPPELKLTIRRQDFHSSLPVRLNRSFWKSLIRMRLVGFVPLA